MFFSGERAQSLGEKDVYTEDKQNGQNKYEEQSRRCFTGVFFIQSSNYIL